MQSKDQQIATLTDEVERLKEVANETQQELQWAREDRDAALAEVERLKEHQALTLTHEQLRKIAEWMPNVRWSFDYTSTLPDGCAVWVEDHRQTSGRWRFAPDTDANDTLAMAGEAIKQGMDAHAVLEVLLPSGPDDTRAAMNRACLAVLAYIEQKEQTDE